MLVLALIAWLAASAPEAVTRIPGSPFSLGMAETQMQDLAEFPAVHVADAAGATTRQGDAKFFGVACQATLYFRDGRLTRVQYESKTISPKSVDYIEDQLRRAKLFRECERLEPGHHVCDWLGDVKIHLETRADQMNARVEMPPRPWETEADSAHVEPPAAAPAAAPVSPVAMPPAPATPVPTPVRETPAATTPPIATPVAEEHPAKPVPTLPETLRLSLPERNAPSEWPRLTSNPKLEYPEAARKESVQGIVWVLALVDTNGTVRSATIDRGIRELNDAAVTWAWKVRFAPCIREGVACRFWVRIAARFTLY